jgi:hypothetical protein
MANDTPSRLEVINAIVSTASSIGHPPSRAEFIRNSGIGEHRINAHFSSWNEAVVAAGLEPNTKNLPIDETALLEDWGELVRRLRRIPTFVKYRLEGKYSPDVFQKRFGAWSKMPDAFRQFAKDKPDWTDVVALLPLPSAPMPNPDPQDPSLGSSIPASDGTVFASAGIRHSKLSDRPTYGNPIDFRGLRHEPVNEQGVVFLFGMVAKELGYLVEAVQTGFPDCEAKRQIGPNKWQRVRIEFEFESRNFYDHGHAVDGCDVIVCWRHNWPNAPAHLDVVELATVINTLSRDVE